MLQNGRPLPEQRLYLTASPSVRFPFCLLKLFFFFSPVFLFKPFSTEVFILLPPLSYWNPPSSETTLYCEGFPALSSATGGCEESRAHKDGDKHRPVPGLETQPRPHPLSLTRAQKWRCGAVSPRLRDAGRGGAAAGADRRAGGREGFGGTRGDGGGSVMVWGKADREPAVLCCVSSKEI